MAANRKMGMIKFVMVALVASSMWAVSMAQSGTSSSCTNVLISLSPCLNYITGNSSTPSSSCCTQLASVVKDDPQCLCQVINGGGSSLAAGMNINQTQALGLPTACKVQTPPISQCSGGASSPSGSPTGTSTTPTYSNGGSKTTPTTDGDSSDANMSKSAAAPLFLALVFIVSHVLAFNAV